MMPMVAAVLESMPVLVSKVWLVEMPLLCCCR
jgi:hypothetical protein